MRTFLAVPLRQQGELIGALIARRIEVRPFTPAQIKLLETFADQAVIAIENVRLFQELKESLEQQTATSEILGVIASSPTDIQPVLDVVAENAARLCDATDALIFRCRRRCTSHVAHYGSMPVPRRETSARLAVGRLTAERCSTGRRFIFMTWQRSSKTNFRIARAMHELRASGHCLAMPLLREGVAIGAIFIRRTEVRPFTEKQIDLLKTFADSSGDRHRERAAVQGNQERNAELREALEHQTATAEVLGIISRSPTDVQPVLDAIVESAARVCGIDDVVLRLREGNDYGCAGSFWSHTLSRVEISIDEPQFRWMRRAWHAPHSRRPRAERFPNVRYRQRLRVPSCSFPFVSRENSLEH